jgi:hypothetical protein
MWPKLKSMTDLTREAVSIADDYFRPVGVVSVSALEVRPRLVAVIQPKFSERRLSPIAGIRLSKKKQIFNVRSNLP